MTALFAFFMASCAKEEEKAAVEVVRRKND
jgi:hypothetical protein